CSLVRLRFKLPGRATASRLRPGSPPFQLLVANLVPVSRLCDGELRPRGLFNRPTIRAYTGHGDLGSLMQVLKSDFGHRDVKARFETIFQPPNDAPLLLERGGSRDDQVQRDKAEVKAVAVRHPLHLPTVKGASHLLHLEDLDNVALFDV